MEDIKYFQSSPWPYVKWGKNDRPIIIIDGKLYSANEIEKGHVMGERTYIVGATNKNIETICNSFSAKFVYFYDMQVKDLNTLISIKELKHLAIRWNSKATNIKFLNKIENIETLIFEDTPKIGSLEPLKKLNKLSYLEFSGGTWNKNKIESLEPLNQLYSLKTLILQNIKIIDDSLWPIANCVNLKSLTLSNQFKTEDYAFLQSKLPSTKCEYFTSYIKLNNSIEEKDVMVIGRRKPFLNSSKDKERLTKYENAYNKLVQEYTLNK